VNTTNQVIEADELLNVNGQLTRHFDFGNHASGTYLLQIANGTTTVSRKVIIIP